MKQILEDMAEAREYKKEYETMSEEKIPLTIYVTEKEIDALISVSEKIRKSHEHYENCKELDSFMPDAELQLGLECEHVDNLIAAGFLPVSTWFTDDDIKDWVDSQG